MKQRARTQAVWNEAVDACFDKIMDDICFSPPEVRETELRLRIKLRLQRMANFLWDLDVFYDGTEEIPELPLRDQIERI